MNDAQVTKALKVMELVSLSPAFGTEEGGPPLSRRAMGREIGYLGSVWRCWNCKWEGVEDDLVEHYLDFHA